MVLDFFRRSSDKALEHCEVKLAKMLSDGRHAFDAAMSALLGGADPAVVGPDVRATDRGINLTEQEIRRELLIHASVTRALDVPLVLGYMSIVKDAERVGDYAKNVFDLAAYGVNLSTAKDRDALVGYRDRVSSMIAETARIFSERDAEQARAFITEADDVLDEFDDLVQEAIHSEGRAADEVPRALLCRYLKRITAHLMNILTVLVMSVDQIDYFDEDRETRE
ncbi:MAG: PhoU domain-containing protein [Acidimicrobiia bacterium]